jgi:predicted Zn-dependent peptidase
MSVSKRDVLRGLFVGGIVTQLPTASWAISDNTQWPPTFTLNNGLRVHLTPKESGYVSAALVLRSKHIDDPRGLAHIMEHTSFTGAAGSMTAKQIKDLHSDCVQESNATTGGGMIQWNASVLSKNTAQLLELLATTSLDQKFDVETVASEARVVLQELYLDKFDAQGRAKQQFDSSLYGPSHPFARDTTETEIATARTPAPILAAELAQYSRSLKLPANMDLFMVGEFDSDQVTEMVQKSFGRFAFAEGPRLDVPNVGMTRGHKSISALSNGLKRPLSEIRIAWNTGVRATDPQAGILLALGEYLNKVLFTELREKSGDSYTPEASFKADSCSGIFKIKIQSSSNPELVERRIFDALATLKESIDAKELQRFSDKLELKRCKDAQRNDDILECMIERTLHGASPQDLQVKAITVGEIRSAARKFLPSHKSGYVRLTFVGR